MPEIKHNFTKGKMNKDLDERLIPNGEYRDAMNIQVSTSEGADVGTVQNILGNSIAPGQEFIGDDSTCVGSIADEKNDKLYYFINQTPLEVDQLLWPPFLSQSNTITSDIIVEYNSVTNTTIPIFVDTYSVSVGTDTSNPPSSTPSATINVASTSRLRVGMELNVFKRSFSSSTFSFVVSNIITGSPNNLSKPPTIIAIPSSTTVTLSTEISLLTTQTNRLVFTAPRVLKFHKDRLITGINIIDDMLL